MKLELNNLDAGMRIVYDDGRPGHSGVCATVLKAGKTNMVVQFDDRADTTTIKYSDAGWIDYLSLCPEFKA